MIDPEQIQRIASRLPMLRGADPVMVREFMQKAYLARIPAGKDVFVEGDVADSIALLLSGMVRVYKIGGTGREITLYRFGHGESCILTANAILSRQSFPAIATVEKEAEAAMVPAEVFLDWVHRHDAWRNFVFDLLSQRLSGVLEIVEEVVFRRMDARLASFLLERSRTRNPIRITHQEIADELGSSREVISRILEDFTGQGWVGLKRGEIEILDAESLKTGPLCDIVTDKRRRIAYTGIQQTKTYPDRRYEMNPFIAFMASPAGRITRIIAGVALIAWGLLGLGGLTGAVVAAIGAVPLLAGLVDVCLFAPLFGAPLSGPKIRAGK